MAIHALAQSEDAWHLVSHHPIHLVLILFAIVSLSYRIWTSSKYSYAQKKDVTKEPPMLPHWVPWIGHGFSYTFDNAGLFTAARDKSKDGAFAIKLVGYKHYQVLMPSLVKQVFAQRATVLSNKPLIHWLAKHGFGDEGTTAKVPELYSHISSNLNILMTEATITDASDRTARAVGETISSFALEQIPWENGSIPTVVGEKGEESEVDFFRLVTRWAYFCSAPAFFGQALIEKCPQLMDDVFVFDSQFPLLITGLPPFTSKIRNARDALNRSKKAMEMWYEAYKAIEDNHTPLPGWEDMSDVSELAKMQHRTWRTGGKEAEKAAIANILSLFWGLHTNANIITFWTLVHIYSCADLLFDIRAEVAPHVKTLPTGQASIDHAALSRQCPLTKSTWLETMRQDIVGVEQKYIEEDFTITESPSDAALLRGQGATPRSYELKAGNVVCVHNGAAHTDPRLWENPKEFNPRRFIITDPRHENREKAESPRHLYAFGGGYSMCKGRLFAEREVLTFVAAVVTFWDIDFLGPKKSNGEWIIKKGMEAGAPHPAGDVRVRAKKRNSAKR
ncbi:uncharacterized protein RAG0_16184 [Rhynchosporium agropyri]|uniref:Cytochrome P450 n=1 Tax=Rhynchosporium agropyri TaxID=914238 RepID=A0A1E1LPA0_9HELO|nr:uncharacterized protein RAG0_16184 [Rhynchosporium agropyri]